MNEAGSPSTRVLDGEVVVVTGAAGGIGGAVVRACLDGGATVVAVERARERHGPVGSDTSSSPICYRADAANPDSLRDLAAFVASELGAATGVVATVGARPVPTALESVTFADWNACLTTNLSTTFLTFQAFVPQMTRAGAGSLVAVSSIVARRGSPRQAAYSASKAGLVALVRSAAAELGPSRVRVNCVTPGITFTERTRGKLLAEAEEKGIDIQAVEDAATADAALRRGASPEEIANACCFLLSSHAAAVTGEDLNVSNGTVMY